MHPWVGDVSDLAAVTALMNGVAERFGHLDVLVSNAGLAQPGTVESTSEDAYRAMMSVNVDGPFFASRAALPTCARPAGASSTSDPWATRAVTGRRPLTTRPRARWPT
jgi:NAD(P)-dependent dehydrogenase (short-subunit alcohol dehydrogenase family)